MSISPLGAAFKARCPRCGEGKLFSGLLQISPRCSSCGLSLAEYDLGDGPAFFVIVLDGMLICALAVWFELQASPPLWAHLLLWPPAILVSSVGLLRWFKGWLLAMHYRLKSRGVEDE